MTKNNGQTILESYSKIARWYNENRSRDLFEKTWLDKAMSHLSPGAQILDLGCGMGEPIAKYFIDQGFRVTGVDGCKELLEIAKTNLPNGVFLINDMRKLSLDSKFDFIIAWNSFFHLRVDEQKQMFSVFTNHLKNNGLLMFTTGPKAGEIWSDNGGEKLYHASLAPDEYKELLDKHNFELIQYKINDKNCNYHTVWLAKYVA
jgi:2-polyprenyl-3-methyl-5-hydroxy-6-metoxy-1,4-benzoquinol methylase